MISLYFFFFPYIFLCFMKFQFFLCMLCSYSCHYNNHYYWYMVCYVDVVYSLWNTFNNLSKEMISSFISICGKPNQKKKKKSSTLFNKLFFNLSLITKNVTVKSFIIFQVFLGGGKKEKIDPRACHYYLWSLSRHFKFCSINRFCYYYFNDCIVVVIVDIIVIVMDVRRFIHSPRPDAPKFYTAPLLRNKLAVAVLPCPTAKDNGVLPT